MISVKRTEASKSYEFDEAKEKAIAEINTLSGEARSKYVTPIAGQEMIYEAKRRQAHTFLATHPEPKDLSKFSLISNEIGITGESAYQVAVIFAHMSEQWEGIRDDLERARVEANYKVASSATLAEVGSHVEKFKKQMIFF